MLKKTGILVATAAAGLLALSPLAFAQDSLDYTNIEDGNQTNDCSFDQSASEVDSDLVGGSSFAGLAGAVANIVTPADVQTQAANCNNIGITDVLDSGSGNTTEETEVTEIEESFNSVED